MQELKHRQCNLALKKKKDLTTIKSIFTQPNPYTTPEHTCHKAFKNEVCLKLFEVKKKKNNIKYMYFQESFKYNTIFIFATTQGINYIIFYQGTITHHCD